MSTALRANGEGKGETGVQPAGAHRGDSGELLVGLAKWLQVGLAVAL